MNTIEKAKAYDEALERAKQIRNGNPSSGTAIVVCEQIFPELRESEDERIRKALIDALKVSETIGELKFRLPYPTREECIAYLEKQKEQKPWKVGANAYFTPEQEPVVTHGETYHVDTLGTQQVIAGKMPQKPAEWSEKDADILNCCISSIEEAKENRYAYKETDGDTSYDREIDWLKSLRPSWKPSEEQMAVLLNAESLMYANNYKEKAKILAEFIEELKQLCQ